MKMISNLWKSGVAILLCFYMLSVSVMAHDEHTEADEHEYLEEAHETTDVPVTDHEEMELPDVEHESEFLSAHEEEATDLPHIEGEVDIALTDESKNERNPELEKSAEETATEETATEEKTEPAIGTVVKRGDCGFYTGSLYYEVTYLGDEEYKLTISGTGKMLTIGATYGAPWHGYSKDIVSIELQDGLESIAQYAFTDCDQVTSITIPASVSAIYPKSFQMLGLKEVYFLGPYYAKFKPDAFDRTSDLIIYYDQTDPSWSGVSFNNNVTMQGSDVTLEVIVANDATCTTDGNPLYYYNTTWGKYFSDAEGKLEITDQNSLVIPALGHDWDEGAVTQKPTATEGGIITFTCKRCKDTRYDSVPATGEETMPGEPELPGNDTQTPGDDIQMPGDGTQEPDLKDDITEDTVDVNVNVNFQNKPGTGQTAAASAQKEETTAGRVKTADENPYVLYLVLFALSGIVLFEVIRKRILK